jgi:chromosome segregation ATPase
MAKKPTEAFKVPSLESASPEYAALIAKRQELQDRYSALNAERSKLRKDIEAAKAAGGQRLSTGVAALLGEDPVDSVTALSKRLREVVTTMSDVENAQEVLRRRIDEARNVASKIVCDGVSQEYQRRLGAMCDAARALEAARQDHDALLDDLEREDVRKDYLRPVVPFFLGDRRDGKVSYFLREAKGAGYNV